jgi:chaperonin GroEL
MSKLIQFEETSLNSLAEGLKILARAVKITLGPRGRNVIITKNGQPQSTKDGVTVAEHVNLKEPFHNLSAQLVKKIAQKTAENAGDGTTTAIVLAEALFLQGIKNVAAGANPMMIKRGIDEGVEVLCAALKKMAKEVSTHEEILQVATISANNDAVIGKIIADAIKKVGKNGIVTIQEGKGTDTSLRVIEGMQFDKGYTSPYFITNQASMAVEYEKAMIFITDQKFSTAKEILPVLEAAMGQMGKVQRPLIIIAEDVDGEALTTLVMNKVKGGMPICAVKAPGYGDKRKAMLMDIAILTGGVFYCEELGHKISKVDGKAFGEAKSIQITKDETIIVGGNGSQQDIQERVTQLKKEFQLAAYAYDRQKLEERIARLSGGVGVIELGANTEAEMKEKKDRVDDALHATRAAILQGIVPGGGVALLRAIKALDQLSFTGDKRIGLEILKEALFAPATAIANNCGKAGNLIAHKIYEASGNWGYNGLNDTYGDMIEAGVIDPVLVTISALRNAASIITLLLTTSAIVVDKPEKPKKGGSPYPGGMGMDDSMMDMM